MPTKTSTATLSTLHNMQEIPSPRDDERDDLVLTICGDRCPDSEIDAHNAECPECLRELDAWDRIPYRP